MKAANIENFDVIFALDNTDCRFSANLEPVQKIKFPYGEADCLLFDKHLHDSLNLPYYTNSMNTNFSQVMWNNGDYPFYYVKKFFPDYDYYWQIDYDVYLNGNSYKEFLKQYDNNDKDILVCHFRKEEYSSNWFWVKFIDWIYKEPIQLYGSFFPICRLSNKAIDFLYKKRIEQSEIFKNSKIKKKRWLNCEIFTPTELLNNGYTGEALKDIENVKLFEELDIVDDVFALKDNKPYHPIKYNYISRINKPIPKEYFSLLSIKSSQDSSHIVITICGIKIRVKKFSINKK
jgi:hypothetical protein